MYRIKKYSIAIGAMIGMTLVSLLIVSTLTYLFKWQADKAMIGIIVTYILVGFAGGFVLKRVSRKQNADERKKGVLQKALEAFSLSSIFTLIMTTLSLSMITRRLNRNTLVS